MLSPLAALTSATLYQLKYKKNEKRKYPTIRVSLDFARLYIRSFRFVSIRFHCQTACRLEINVLFPCIGRLNRTCVPCTAITQKRRRKNLLEASMGCRHSSFGTRHIAICFRRFFLRSTKTFLCNLYAINKAKATKG